MGIQFNPMQTGVSGSLQRHGDQPRAKPLFPETIHNAHARNATMRLRLTRTAPYIAPADNPSVRQSYELVIAVRQQVQNKGSHSLDRRCFRQAQIPPFPRDAIESQPETVDSVRLHPHNPNSAHAALTLRPSSTPRSCS